MSPNAFVRERKLPLPRLVAFLVNAPRAGLQCELDAFFDHALGGAQARPLSKSALCQARRQLRASALRLLVGHSAQVFAAHSQVPLWHGRRVLALDGSTLRVPDVPECAEFFGGMHTSCGRFRPLARASALFDVARNAFVDATLGGFAEDERALARQHLPHLGAQDLLLMDRGYPSRQWFAELNARGVAFCARISERTWGAVAQFARGRRNDAQADLGTSDSPLPLRLLRVKRPDGSRLVMVTNVFDQSLPRKACAELYRGRWKIEEAFKLIKARLQLENWSGILPHTVEQDFFANLLRANCAAVLALVARPEDAAVSADTPLDAQGWRQRINRTLTLKSLRHYLPRLLLGFDMVRVLDLLVERLRSPTAIERTRPLRSAPRPKGVRIADFHFAYKAA